jgi:hypothetical protein
MGAKQDESGKHKAKSSVPSTGRGAASAMDALIRKRGPAPSGGPAPQPQQNNKAKKG